VNTKMSSIESEIKLRAAGLREKVIGHRRHLHQNPELSFQEYNTAKYVAGSLEAIGIEPEIGVADTGVVAVIKGLKSGNDGVIALRADMDALPIFEANDLSYKSQVDGVMHACGHDAHTASLLGVADILHGMREHFSGTVKLIFQPGEEKSPGGASLMIKAGVLENPKPSHIIGQHVMPLIPAGKVGFREGMYMASTDEIYIKVKGKGGHAAMPEQNVDPILIASHLVVAMQQLVSRWSSPKTPSVLSIGKMIANGANNVIPNEVTLEGTFRTMDEPWRADAKERLTKLAIGLVESMGGVCEINIIKGYPYLENNPELTRSLRGYAEDYLGAENVLELDKWMAGEDFSYYTHEAKGCFYRLGTRNEARGITSSVHMPTFDIEESALEIGCGLMTYLALRQLGNG